MTRDQIIDAVARLYLDAEPHSAEERALQELAVRLCGSDDEATRRVEDVLERDNGTEDIYLGLAAEIHGHVTAQGSVEDVASLLRAFSPPVLL